MNVESNYTSWDFQGEITQLHYSLSVIYRKNYFETPERNRQ